MLLRMVLVCSLFFLLISCGKATRIDAHKTPSQLQTKSAQTEKIPAKEIEAPHATEDQNTMPKQEPTEIVIDSSLREKVEKALSHVNIKSFVLSSMLSKESWLKAQKFSFDMISCGVGYLGPKCSFYQTIVNNESLSLYRFKGRYYFFVEFKTFDKEPPLAFLFHLEKVEPEVTVKKVDVYSLNQQRPPSTEIMSYLADKTMSTLWSELGLTKTSSNAELSFPLDQNR